MKLKNKLYNVKNSFGAFFTLLINMLLCGFSVHAADSHEIGSVTLLADKRLALPISQIISQYAHENPVTVSAGFGESIEQERRIEDGESCDLFITADNSLLEKMKIKGLIDIHSVSELVATKKEHYFAAVVAGENMTPARAFLAFLKNGEARTIFRKSDAGNP